MTLALLGSASTFAAMPLRVGDKCPDIVFSLFNQSFNKTIRLSQLGNKLIVLDLGAFNCSSCVESALHWSEYQSGEFKGKIAPLFVISDGQKRATESWNANLKLHRITVPIVYSNEVIEKYFPHTFTPQEVWINSKGIIIAITDAQYVEAKYIKEAITNPSLDWQIKYDAYDIKQPLIQLNKGNMPFIKKMPLMLSYTVFCGHLNGIPDRMDLYGINRANSSKQEKIDSVINGLVRVQLLNRPILDIFEHISGKTFTKSRIAYYVQDVDNYNYDVYGPDKYDVDWRRAHTFCYDGTFPSSMPPDNIRRQIWAYIENALNIKVSIEKKFIDCWVLKGIPDSSKRSTNIPTDSLYGFNKFSKPSGFIRIQDLAWYAERLAGNPPVFIDPTIQHGDEYHVKVSTQSLCDFDQLNQTFHQLGLTLRKEKREVEMLVIKELNYSGNQN